MGKIALVFPGQGSQAVGMGEELAAAHPAAARIFEQAGDVLGWDVAKLCFTGPGEELSLTEFAQPALYVASLAAMAVIEEKGIVAEAVTGHSLGEFSALAAAGAVSFEEGLKLVARRGEVMAAAAHKQPGSMAAILGLEDFQVEEICTASGQVWAVNYNCPGQLVISGETAAVRAAMRAAEEAGAKKVVELAVSGSFHTPLMDGAAAEFREILAEKDFRDPEPGFISSITCEAENASSLQELMSRQMVSPVRWRQTIEKMIGGGFDTFVEVGSGKVLTGLIKRICKVTGSEVAALNVADTSSLEKTMAAL